jgi:hypothetical protein
MLTERGLQVMNVEVVGDAYAIASNYLRKSGAVSDTLATNDRLLELIVEMFHRGEYNKISSPTRRLRNSRRLSSSDASPLQARCSKPSPKKNLKRISWKPPSTASCRPTPCW